MPSGNGSNKLIKILRDIKPAMSGTFVVDESKIDLRDSIETIDPGLSIELPVAEDSNRDGASNGAMDNETAGSNFNDLLSDVIREKIPSHEELASVMEQASDPIVELASIGAEFNGDFRPILTSNPNTKKSEEDDFHRRIMDKIREPVSSRVAISLAGNNLAKSEPLQRKTLRAKPVFVGTKSVTTSPEGFIKEEQVISTPDARVADFYTPKQDFKKRVLPVPILAGISGLQAKPSLNFKPKPLDFSTERKSRFPHKWIIILIVLGLLAYGLTLKNELIRESFSAIDNLQQAQESLKNYNFSGAAKNFNDSYKDFTSAGQNLNLMGAGLISIFGDLPGTGKIKSAKDIVEVGKLLAGAGQAISEAVGSLSKTGAILNPIDKEKTKPSKIVSQIKSALKLSDKNLQKAKILLATIDDSIIPEDKRDNFHDFKDKIPLFEEYLGDAIEYADFLEGIVGIDEPKKYLLLFENNSELRPTGGFPGTYGVVSFASGGLSDFFVNDVYNLDGQLKRNIIPPKQLQHITPNWGMRDSAWFLDFPTSAEKAMWFFEQEAGYGVDGVITVNPDIVSAILSIVGPINLPAYDMTLTASNFVESIQEEVEYGPNRTQPKQVVTDFAPLFLEKLYSADSEKWMKIFNVLMAGLDEKDILFYFDEKDLEKFSIEKGFGGEIKNTDADYMMVTFSNIKGSKTDVVTDSSISIDTRFDDNSAVHKVKITRNHKGGDKEHGFYNKQNPAYVRVLLPEDAELVSVSGNDNPNFRPLISYDGQSGFEPDPDLNIYESEFYFDNVLGIDKFKESGKKGIGFWMITDPGTTKEVEFEYSVPVSGGDYSFYFQKQPGLDWKNFKFNVKAPVDRDIAETIPSLSRIGDLYTFNEILNKDLEFKINFK